MIADLDGVLLNEAIDRLFAAEAKSLVGDPALAAAISPDLDKWLEAFRWDWVVPSATTTSKMAESQAFRTTHHPPKAILHVCRDVLHLAVTAVVKSWIEGRIKLVGIALPHGENFDGVNIDSGPARVDEYCFDHERSMVTRRFAAGEWESVRIAAAPVSWRVPKTMSTTAATEKLKAQLEATGRTGRLHDIADAAGVPRAIALEIQQSGALGTRRRPGRPRKPTQQN